MKNIKSGYQVHVTTWENDGDNYNTTVTSGLSKEDAAFIVELAKKFDSKSDIGNDFVDDEKLTEVINEVFKDSKELSSELLEIWQAPIETIEDDSCDIRDLLREYILSQPSEGYDSDFCRVVESIDVYYIPEEIKNVTNEFI